MNMVIFEEWNLGCYLQATERRAEPLRSLDRPILDSILQKVTPFDFKNDWFPRFYLSKAIFVENGFLKCYLKTGFDSKLKG